MPVRRTLAGSWEERPGQGAGGERSLLQGGLGPRPRVRPAPAAHLPRAALSRPSPSQGRPAAHGGAGSNLGRNVSGARGRQPPKDPFPAASRPAPPAGLIAESGLIGNANGN